MVGVVAPLTASVQYPAARWEVMIAVAALGDPEYQERVWIRQDVPYAGYEDSLDVTVHTLFDDWAVLPDPRAAVGPILVDGPEVERLQVLGQLLGDLIDDLGDRPDEDYLRDKRWSQVVQIASKALSALVLAGSPTVIDQS